jgi:hypothetical protein
VFSSIISMEILDICVDVLFDITNNDEELTDSCFCGMWEMQYGKHKVWECVHRSHPLYLQWCIPFM